MDNNKIEKMLYEASRDLPTTAIEWRAFDMKEHQVRERNWKTNKIVAACLVMVFLFGFGGVTVLANVEMNINPGEYGQWVDIRYDNSWYSCEKESESRGFVLPEEFGAYKFDNFSTLLVARHGTTYLEALTKNVYNPMSIIYDDNDRKEGSMTREDAHWISISVGTLDENYWSIYYEFEMKDDKWEYSDAETFFEYEGVTVFGKKINYAMCKEWNYRWIDHKKGLCWSVYVPVDTGLDSEVESAEIIKEIIDLNRE